MYRATRGKAYSTFYPMDVNPIDRIKGFND